MPGKHIKCPNKSTVISKVPWATKHQVYKISFRKAIVESILQMTNTDNNSVIQDLFFKKQNKLDVILFREFLKKSMHSNWLLRQCQYCHKNQKHKSIKCMLKCSVEKMSIHRVTINLWKRHSYMKISQLSKQQ